MRSLARPGLEVASRVLVVSAAVLLGASSLACGHPGLEGSAGRTDPAIDDPALRRALDSITADAIRRHVEILSADELRGREAFSRGYRAAADYVARRFEEIGLQPADDDGDYLRTVSFRRARLRRQRSSLTLIREGRPEELAFGSDYFISGGSLLRTETQVTAPVAFVGFGISDPSLGWDDYEGLDVRGKIVLMVFGAPPGLAGHQRNYYLISSAKQRMVEARGAVGMLTLVPPTNPAPFADLVRRATTSTVRWLGPRGRPADTSGRIRAAAVLSAAGAARFFAAGGTTLEEALQRLESGSTASRDLAVEASLRVASRHRELTSPNVVALLPGSDPDLRNETVVFTAHLDHLGVGPPRGDDEIYNGAYDNASGTAILIEVARALASLPRPPRRSVLFAAVTAEEKGLQGSDHLAAHPPSSAGEIVAAVNMDMVLMLYPPADVIAFGAEHSSLGPMVEDAAAELGLSVTPDPIPEMNVFFRSDQYSFARRGIPAVMVFPGLESAEPEVDGAAAFERWMTTTYHHPSDESGQEFRWSAGVTIARVDALLGLAIANADARPTWNEVDFFGERFGAQRGEP